MQLSKLVAAVAGVAISIGVRGAIAGPNRAKKIKAQFLCGTYVDGKIKQPITGGRVAKITDPIACAIHVADPDEPSHMGNVHTVRHVQPKQVVTSGKTDDFGSQSDEGKKDFNVFLKPSVADENGEVAFKPCEDFDIVGTVADDLGVYFTKTIKVQQSCPKPKPIKAKLGCYYQTEDGTTFVWPGNGAKAKPRLEGVVTCVIEMPDLDNVSGWTGKLAVKGQHVHDVEVHSMEYGSGADQQFSSEEHGVCSNFTVVGSIADPDGNERFAGKLDIKQDCPD